MKHIGLLIGSMNSGGAERVVSHLSQILSSQYDVHVILFEDTYHEYACEGIMHCLNAPAKAGNLFVKLGLLNKRIKALKKVVREEKLSCVISFLDSPNFVNLFSKVKGCRRIISIRNYSGLANKQTFLGKVTDFAMKLLYRRADHVITVSKLIERDFMAHYHIPKDKITTIYNPYHFDEIQQKTTEELNKEEQTFFEDRFVFCNVGRIMYQKGIWHLIKSFATVHKAHPQTGLVIVGEDLSNGNLTHLIAELGLQDAVLLTGRTRNPYKYMYHSQVYVLSSLFEGFPNAMVEAMACRCAVIAADCKSGPREILFENPDLEQTATTIQQADYGVLVPTLEPKENWNAAVRTEKEEILAGAMIAIINDKKMWQKNAQSAKQRSRVFDYDAASHAFSRLIEEESMNTTHDS